MTTVISPTGRDNFATACFNEKVKTSLFGSLTVNFTMKFHDKGDNHVESYPGEYKPYLATASDDKTLESFVQNLEFHCFLSSISICHCQTLEERNLRTVWRMIWATLWSEHAVFRPNKITTGCELVCSNCHTVSVNVTSVRTAWRR